MAKPKDETWVCKDRSCKFTVRNRPVNLEAPRCPDHGVMVEQREVDGQQSMFGAP